VVEAGAGSPSGQEAGPSKGGGCISGVGTTAVSSGATTVTDLWGLRALGLPTDDEATSGQPQGGKQPGKPVLQGPLPPKALRLCAAYLSQCTLASRSGGFVPHHLPCFKAVKPLTDPAAEYSSLVQGVGIDKSRVILAALLGVVPGMDQYRASHDEVQKSVNAVHSLVKQSKDWYSREVLKLGFSQERSNKPGEGGGMGGSLTVWGITQVAHTLRTWMTAVCGGESRKYNVCDLGCGDGNLVFALLK